MPAMFQDPFGQAFDPFQQKPKRSPALQELQATRPEAAPLDDHSLLSDIGHASLSGLARVGHVLDIPGAMTRNLLTGHNPLAPLFHPMSEQGRTSGREALRQWGLVGDEDTTANWWSGLGAELLLDPLLYAGIGALTKAGKAAQAAGTATKGLGQAIAKGERSLLSVGLPFTEHATHYGTGKAAQAFGGAMDAGLEATANSAPGRMAAGLFDATALGQFGKVGQQVARMIYPARGAGYQKAREAVIEHLGPMREARQAFVDAFGPDIAQRAQAAQPGLNQIADDLTNHTFERFFGLQAELGGDIDQALHEFALDPAKMPADLRSKMTDIGNSMQKAATAINDSALSKGGWGGTLESFDDFEHFARYAHMSEQDIAKAAKELPTLRGSSAHRSEAIGLIPEEIVNRIATDPLARAKNVDDVDRAAGHIAQKYGHYLGKGTMLDEAGKPVPRWEGIGQHAEELVVWANQHPERAIFLNPKIEDFSRYMRQAHLADSSYDVVHELVKQNMGARLAVDLTAAGHQAENLVKLPDFYKAAGMNPAKSLEYLATLTGKNVEELNNLAMPLDVANAVRSARQAANDPNWLGAIGGLVDQMTNFWKQTVTLPFPSFAGRNWFSGQYVNATSGLMPTLQHLSRYGQHVRNAMGMLRGGIDPALEKELLIHDVFNPRQLSEGVEAGIYGRFGSAQPANPLEFGQTWREAGADVARARPLSELLEEVAGRPVTYADRVPEMTGARQATGFMLGTGAKFNQAVEFLNRVPLYQYLRAEGWDAGAAAAKVKELQIDYSRHTFSPFENQVVKRLIPFYSYQRRIAPIILDALMKRPGGPIGATIRASRLAAGSDATTPDYITEGLSIPNPFKTPPEGGASYLGGFGLPYEQLAQYVAAPHVAGRELLSQLNPLIKFPLEASTGQTFFQSGPGGYGRPLEDLDPSIGRTLSNIAGRFAPGFDKPVDLPDWFEHAAANSPATRFISTARQLSDPRKTFFDLALANLTGVRPIDVSAAARDAVLRDRAREVMHQMGAKEFTRTYFPGWQEEQLSPQELDRARRLEGLQTQLAARAKERVAAKKAAATSG